MENILLFGLLFSFGLMTLGFWTKMRIFNLISIAPLLYLGFQLSGEITIVIAVVALIIFQLYYTFMGKLS